MSLSPVHYQAALVRLSLFHVAIIAASNYLVQLPINLDAQAHAADAHPSEKIASA